MTFGNTLDDFPATAFTILAFCDACGHRSPLDRSKVSEGRTVQELGNLAMLSVVREPRKREALPSNA
jgi:hypothetical protein